MRYYISELDISYLTDLLNTVKEGVDEDVIDEIEEGLLLLGGIRDEQQKNTLMELAGG